MKRLILSILAAATFTLGAMPTTAQACGGGYSQIDPVEQQIQVVVSEHFRKVRSAVRVQRIQVRYGAGVGASAASEAFATVVFADRRERSFSQEVRLALRGTQWAVVGGSQVSRV